MEIGKNVKVDLKEGKVVLDVNDGAAVLAVNLGVLATPVLDGLIAKVESGAIDPVKGTDLDKEAMLRALNFLKSELLK